MAKSPSNGPPVVLLGGDANTLSILRRLSRRGIAVVVSATGACPALRSRHRKTCYPIPKDRDAKDYWASLLLSQESCELTGSVLFACDDDAVEFLCAYRDDLAQSYLLYDFDPKLHMALLEKRSSLELAKSVGIAVPGFWPVDRLEDVEEILTDLRFPVIVKPLLSHIFRRHFGGRSYLPAETPEQLLFQQKRVWEKNLKSMICEFIPGADSLSRTYNSFRTAEGRVLYQITTHAIRRYPKNIGVIGYQYTEWNPEVAEQGNKLLEGVGFTGLASVEFKLDPRDGRYKLIEVNPRFTAGMEMFCQSGIEIPYVIYCHLIGRPLPECATFDDHVAMMNFAIDLKAYRELRRLGELPFTAWLKSIGSWPTFTYFKLDDPWPATRKLLSSLNQKLLGSMARLRHLHRSAADS